jgi:hypothetical protein
MEYKQVPYENLSSVYAKRLQCQIHAEHVRKHPWKTLYQLSVGKIISRIKGWHYRIKYNVFKMPIIWYEGRNSGTFICAGKPDFKRPLKWTKVTMIGGKRTDETVSCNN